MKINDLTPKKIENLDYSEFVSLIDERNRCSGGVKSVHEIIVNSRLNSESNVLEVGCNTGFTSINIVYFSGCNVTGIDINKSSLELAKQYARRNNLEDRVNFQLEDAENLSFEDETFDLVWASNVTSFVRNKESAISEYLRTLKVGGTLSVIPIYYKKTPPQELVSKVSEAIGNKIEIYTKSSWIDLFNKISKKLDVPLELYYERDFEYEEVSGRIDSFIEAVLDKPRIKAMNKAQKEAILNRARYFYNLFNSNLQHCGYSILLYQKRREQDEVELFLTRSVKND